jgi:retron-type reverse transcriptase
VEIPKPDKGVRKLSIPSVLDRFVQLPIPLITNHWPLLSCYAALDLVISTF